MKDQSMISIVLVENNANDIDVLALKEIHESLDMKFIDYEIIIILQGEQGNLDKLKKTLLELPSIRIILLSYQVAYDVSVSAGIENAIGDFVVNFSIGVDPVESIDHIVKKCSLGNDIVIGSSDDTFFLFKPVKFIFLKLLKVIGYSLPHNATNLICLNRRAVNAVTKSTTFHHQLFMRLTKMGLNQSTLKYQVYKKKHSSSESFKNIMKLLIFNSTKPLRLIGSLSIVFCASNLIFWLIKSSNSYLLGNEIFLVYLGFAVISLLILLLFIMLTFFGEYLARLLYDNNSNHIYDISAELNSKVAFPADRLNTTEQPTEG